LFAVPPRVFNEVALKSLTVLPFLRTAKDPVVLLMTTSTSKAYQVFIAAHAVE
jgi:hypothetical protein